MAKNDYSHGDHMAQLGKVNGLLEAHTRLQIQILKEQKRSKYFKSRKRTFRKDRIENIHSF